MRFVVKFGDNQLNNQFARCLLTCIKTRLLSYMNSPKLISWNTFLDKLFSENPQSSKNYNVSEIVMLAANNLIYSLDSERLVIQVNPSIKVPGYNNINLSTLLKTINYGTRDIHGSYIVTNTFKYFEKNIDQYLNMYFYV